MILYENSFMTLYIVITSLKSVYYDKYWKLLLNKCVSRRRWASQVVSYVGQLFVSAYYLKHNLQFSPKFQGF